ncbi:MAG: SGNH/GDSL hydrolase family protein [Pseudomonadota bacterium]
MPVLSVRQKEIATGLVILFVFGGLFVAGEVSIRGLQLLKFGVQKSVEKSSAFYIEDESGLRLPKPNRQLGKVRINNLGFRGPDVSLERDDNGFRIAFLGSSTTYDAGVGEASNWPARVTNLVDDSIADCEVDFVNAGLPGYNTYLMHRYYGSHVTDTKPNLVVVLPGDMNHDLDDLAGKKGISSTHFERSWFADVSVFWAKLEKNFRVIQLQRAAHLNTGKLPVEPEEITPRFEQRLRDLVSEIQSDGRLVALVTIGSQIRRDQSPAEQVTAANTNLFYMPYMSISKLIEIREAYNKVIERVANETGAILIDDADSIPGDRKHYVDTMHFSEAGSEKMAGRVSSQLLQSNQMTDVLEEAGCI